MASSSDPVAASRLVRAPRVQSDVVPWLAPLAILTTEDLLDEVGVTMAVEEEDEDEVERFREFLDEVSAEDFEESPDRGDEEGHR